MPDKNKIIIFRKEVPILFKDKEKCCGCGACDVICPKSAITMIMDKEGFYYPEINSVNCIRCLQCVKICPIKDEIEVEV